MAKLARRGSQGGGNLVLTDGGAARAAELTERARRGDQRARRLRRPDLVPGLRHVQRRRHAARRRRRSTTRSRSNVAQFGARFNTGHAAPDVRADAARLRDPEPGPAATRRSRASSTSTQPRSTAAGGRVGRLVADSGARDAAAVPDADRRSARSRSARGTSAILGALLPQPSTEYDHPLGLEPYAVTYTGYILFCNLVDCQYERKSRPALPNEPAPPGPAAGRLRRAA